MRKTLVILLLSCVMIPQAFCGEYGGGDGTAENPYQIATVEHLLELGKTKADYKSHFILTADLDMAGTVYKRSIIAPDLNDKYWGHNGGAFNGIFDGGGHTISNYNADNRIVDYMALFGHVGKNGTIKNLNIVNGDVKGNDFVALLAAGCRGTIENCTVSGILWGHFVLGGIVGYLDNASIKNSMSNVKISAYKRLGKLRAAGGFSATNHCSVIDNCYSKCSIWAKRLSFAGFLPVPIVGLLLTVAVKE